VQSIRNRVIGVVVKPTEEGMVLVRRAASRIAATLSPTVEDDLFALAERNTGAKARKYHDAAVELQMFGSFPADSFVRMFVKSEKFNPFTKRNPDPRAIQYRGSKYCVELAQYLRPIEEQLYLFSSASSGVDKSRNIVKGLNAMGRAQLLVSKASNFRRPVFIILDGSRFDKHVGTGLLGAEHSVYRCANPSPRFAELLKLQLHNKVYTTLGIKYKTKGRRMSGDMNTACGNCVIMLILVYAYCVFVLALSKWDCIDDGDDCIVIIELEDLPIFQARLSCSFEGFGMEMKMDVVHDIHEVDFCQSRVVEYFPGQYKFVRDYRVVMSKATSGVRNWTNASYRTRAIHAIGVCELVLGLGVPILQEYALALIRNSKGVRDFLSHAPTGLRYRAARDAKAIGIKDYRKTTPQPILPCARESFHKSFGVSPADQMFLEEKLRRWTFDSSSLSVWGNEWETSTWTCAQSTADITPL
jgi:hypothetical protein